MPVVPKLVEFVLCYVMLCYVTGKLNPDESAESHSEERLRARTRRGCARERYESNACLHESALAPSAAGASRMAELHSFLEVAELHFAPRAAAVLKRHLISCCCCTTRGARPATRRTAEPARAATLSSLVAPAARISRPVCRPAHGAEKVTVDTEGCGWA